jgi:hypothetical protein
VGHGHGSSSASGYERLRDIPAVLAKKVNADSKIVPLRDCRPGADRVPAADLPVTTSAFL